MKFSKRFPWSRNASSTKSAHSVTVTHLLHENNTSKTDVMKQRALFLRLFVILQQPIWTKRLLPFNMVLSTAPRRFGLQRIWPIIIVPPA